MNVYMVAKESQGLANYLGSIHLWLSATIRESRVPT